MLYLARLKEVKLTLMYNVRLIGLGHSAPVSLGDTFQDLLQITKTADGSEHHKKLVFCVHTYLYTYTETSTTITNNTMKQL